MLHSPSLSASPSSSSNISVHQYDDPGLDSAGSESQESKNDKHIHIHKPHTTHDEREATTTAPNANNASHSNSSSNASPSTSEGVGQGQGAGEGRRVDRVMELRLEDISARFDQFDKDCQVASRVVLAISTIEVHDCIVSSPFKKFMCYYQTEEKGRELGSNMVRLEMNSVRPNMAKVEREELRVQLSVLPVRLNVDQSAVEFLVAFFMQMTQALQPPPAAAQPARSSSSGSEEEGVLDEAYIQSLEVSAFKICVDYKPNHIDFKGLQEGDYIQLVHLFPLENVEIDLKRFKTTGMHGWARALTAMGLFWANDIGHTQAHRYVAGVQPIRSLVNVGSGVADLLLIPIDHYKRHGHLMRSLRDGAGAFVKQLSLETVNISARLAQGAQSVLESVDEMLSSSSSSSSSASKPSRRSARQRKANASASSSSSSSMQHGVFSKMANQPQSYQEGLRQAYQSLARGLQTAAHSVIVVPREEYQRYGTKGCVKSVIKSVPGVILRPMIGATEAVSKALLGVQNTVNPLKKKEMDDKYKHARS